MYKAIFIDIDGTLRDNNKNISSRTIEMIRKVTEKGILVILCSGRPRKYTEDISKECHASKYIITSSGGSIYNYEENCIMYVNIMDKQACIELYKIAQEANVRYIMNVGEKRVVNRLKHMDGSETELKTDIETFVNNNDVVQCTIADPDFEKIKNLREKIVNVENVEIKNQHKSLVDSNAPKEGTIYYDIANIESSKGNAIEKICKILNIDLKDTIAIGDDYNDISMFKKVGYSVVMGNASDKIKQYADEITLSNENDGVAIFLEKLLNNGGNIMKNLVSRLNQGTKIIIKGEEYIVKTKTWYSIEEDTNASYVKCELSNDRVLVVIPDDELIYIGKVIENMKYERISDDTIKYNDITFNKTGDGHQFITKIEFGNEDEVEGKCIFEDYEAEKNIISLGILTDKGNRRADVYADILNIEDIEINNIF